MLINVRFSVKYRYYKMKLHIFVMLISHKYLFHSKSRFNEKFSQNLTPIINGCIVLQ